MSMPTDTEVPGGTMAKAPRRSSHRPADPHAVRTWLTEQCATPRGA